MADDERHPNSPIFGVPVHLTDLDGASQNGGVEEQSSFYRILIIWAGDATLLMDKEEQHMATNSVLLCYPEESVRMICDSRTPLRGIQIEYRCFRDNGMIPSPLQEVAPLSRCSPALKRLALELRHAWLHPQRMNHFEHRNGLQTC